MPRSKRRLPLWLFCTLVGLHACGGTTTPASTATGQLTREAAVERLAQTQGTLQVAGLKDRVEVVRDRWGIPHIYARNQDDLFFAQGFVQAQDRLFQMDLWRRTTQGRLAEILGPQYVEADRLRRLLRYRGDMAAEWTSYAPDGRQIIEQFAKGINAWIQIVRTNLPIEFTLAGYEPELWKPEDILSRAEAFTMSGNVTSEVFRARLAAAVGAKRAAALLPPDPVVPVPVPRGTDLTLVDARLGETLAQIGTPARFAPRATTTSALLEWARVLEEAGSNNWVVNGARSVTGRPILANDPHRALDHPSLRYIVHLNAPGWNVIGANQPWLPGVSFGHNDRVAWACTIFRLDAQDLYVEKLNPANLRHYENRGQWVEMEVQKESIRVKGQATPEEVELLYTRHGPVVAVNPERHVAFALRWTGAEPGTAGYLGAIGIGRAQSAKDFRDALKRWKMPAENFVYADVDGNIGYQAAGLAPVRTNWMGLLPVAGWTGEYEWSGWYSLDDLPHEANPPSGFLTTANHNTLPPGEKRVIGYEWSDPARINRIRQVLTSREKFGVEDFQNLQHDALAWNAQQLVPLLSELEADGEIEQARRLLLDWDRNVTKESAAAALYVVWEQRLVERLVEDKVGGPLEDEYARRAGRVLVPGMTEPTPFWFGSNPSRGRDRVLVEALEAAVGVLKQRVGPDMGQWAWGRLHHAVFRHPLATDHDTRRLLNVGPFPRAGYGLTPFNTGVRGFDLVTFEQTNGSSYRHILDLENWDRSVGTSAPGQSGQPVSPHFDDLAKLWADHKYFPLSFGRAAVEANGEATLVLGPG